VSDERVDADAAADGGGADDSQGGRTAVVTPQRPTGKRSRQRAEVDNASGPVELTETDADTLINSIRSAPLLHGHQLNPTGGSSSASGVSSSGRAGSQPATTRVGRGGPSGRTGVAGISGRRRYSANVVPSFVTSIADITSGESPSASSVVDALCGSSKVSAETLFVPTICADVCRFRIRFRRNEIRS